MTRPLGFEAAEAEWNEAFAGRRMTIDDWNHLTLGEQARYGATECKTKGANYSVHVTHDRIAVSVSLPRSLALEGLTEDEACWIEAALHKELEATIYWILNTRRIIAENRR